MSQIRILQDKIHQVIKDIRDINKEANSKAKKTKLQNYKEDPNISHNSGRTLLSGENHHPELDSLTSGEGPEEPSPEPSTSAKCSTTMSERDFACQNFRLIQPTQSHPFRLLTFL